MNKNDHNSKTSSNIYMKHGPLSKLENKNTMTFKNLPLTSYP